MPLNYTPIDIRGNAYSEVFEELLFENNTISKGLVAFEDNVKNNTIFTETSATAQLIPFTAGVPASSGALDSFDALVTPVSGLFYQEFDPRGLRSSRFNNTIKPGAWESLSSEWEKILIGGQYARQASLVTEREFWTGAKASTKAAVAALTAGAPQTSVSAAEKARVAAATGSGMFDGVLTKLIYNSINPTATASVGGRVKVAGTTITAANIATEYKNLYMAIPAQSLVQIESPVIFAPYSHKQMIVDANNNATNFNKQFEVTASGVTFQGLVVEFVPLPESTMIASLKNHIVWCTDLQTDLNFLKVDKIAANREDWFVKICLTIEAHIANQKWNVLYCG